MLNVMRRMKGAKKAILSVVVVGVASSFGFAIYGVWGGALSGTAQGAPNWIAVVNGERVPTRPFQQRRNILLKDFKNQFGDQGATDEQLMPLAERQALGELLGLELASHQARDSDLRVTKAEIRDAILNLPGFQRNGQFIGMARYRDFLRAQALEASEFESEVAQELAAGKVRQMISGLALVSEEELERRFQEEVERVDLDYILLADSEYAEKGSVSESALRGFFGDRAGDYLRPEARRAAYVLFDREARSATIEVPEDEIRQAYERNRESLYSHGEQRRASHILFRIARDAPPEEDESTRRKAEEVLAQIRAGADFGEMARLHSEDPTTAPAGGDLGYFERGRMVAEFEEAAFSMPAGEISEPIRTSFGYHIIKVTGERPAGTQPLEEVRDEISRGLAVQRAQQAIREDADTFAARLSAADAPSFEEAAAAAGLEVRDSGLFSRGEPIEGLGRLPQADEAVYALAAPGEATSPVAISQGLAVFSLREIIPSAPAPFEEVRSEVEEDYRIARARERARATADRILSAEGSLRERAERRKIQVTDLASVSRIQPSPPLSPASKEAAFAAPPGAVLGPFEGEDGLLVLEVKGHSPAPDRVAVEKENLRRRLTTEEKARLYQTLLVHLQNSAKIEINEALLTSRRQGG